MSDLAHKYRIGSEKMTNTPQNDLDIEGNNNSLSGINQGGNQQIVYINQTPPEASIEQFVTIDTPWKPNKRDFLQRDDEINEVMDIIRDDPQIKLQIRGIGGLGKTSLCCQLFWKYCNSDDKDIKHLGWISYSSNLKNTIMKNINSKDVTAEDPELYMRQAKKFFDSLKGSLLLFVDNADDITEEDINFLATCACRVVITSRYEIEAFEDYTLQPFSSEDCMKLYRNLSNDKNADDEDAISKIIELAGHHTQTICLLAKTQKEYYNTAQELLDELNEKGFTLEGVSAEISSGRPGENFGATFFKHMQKLFDIAKIKDRNQLRVLKLFSLLAPNHPLKRRTANEWFNQKNVKKLIQRGWLNEYENGDVYIHPVVAQTVKCSEKTELKTAQNLLDNLADTLYKSHGKDVNIQRALIAHAVSVAEYFADEEDIKLHGLYNAIGIIYFELADYKNSLKYHENNKVICERILGTDNLYIAVTYNNMANTHSNMGEYDKALEYCEKASAICEKLLGTEHPDTAATYNNIAAVHNNMGKYDIALEYYEKARVIREKKIGMEHPDTAATYNNMANAHSDMDEFDKALEYHEKARVIREKKLGKEHPDTAVTYNNVAGVYAEMGEYGKAIECYEKARKIREKILGTEHHYTAVTYDGIANVYCYCGKYKDALEYCRKALVIHEKVLGTEHPHTAIIYNNLGYILKEISKQDISQLNDALEYVQKANTINEEKLGEHWQTALTYNLLSDIYLLSKDIPNAQKYAEQAKAIYEKKKFTEHIYAAENFRTLAEIALAEDDANTALKYAEQARAIFESKLKEQHLNNIKTYRVLADIYEKIGDTTNAEKYRTKSGNER